jgi:hypothetical protein
MLHFLHRRDGSRAFKEHRTCFILDPAGLRGTSEECPSILSTGAALQKMVFFPSLEKAHFVLRASPPSFELSACRARVPSPEASAFRLHRRE